MNLAIDVGNTLAKAALFEQNLLKRHIERLDGQALAELVQEEKIDHVIISSVNPQAEDLLNKVLIATPIRVFKLSYLLPLPIQHLYQTPKTLGMDRVAAAIGATVLRPATNRLVIDAGTCITYDFIDAQNVYHGGSISLGLQMRFRALHEFTAKLPLFSKENFREEMSFIGNSTESSIVSGVINGTIGEIEGFIQLYAEKFGNMSVLFCGGDSPFLSKKVQEKEDHKNKTTENKATKTITVEHQKDLLLIGLNKVLQHNLMLQQ